jgi:hypothetical protein
MLKEVFMSGMDHLQEQQHILCWGLNRGRSGGSAEAAQPHTMCAHTTSSTAVPRTCQDKDAAANDGSSAHHGQRAQAQHLQSMELWQHVITIVSAAQLCCTCWPEQQR